MKPRRAAVIFIFITVTLDMLALGLIMPVLPKLVLNFLGGDTANAAQMFGLFATAFALMQFVFLAGARRALGPVSVGGRSSCFRTSGSASITS